MLETLRTDRDWSPEQVAEVAGLSPATFYVYFASKDQALAAAFDEALGQLEASVFEVLEIETLLELGLGEVLSRAAELAAEGFRRDSRLVRLALARIPDSPEVRNVYRERQRRFLARLERFLGLGQAAGKVRDGDLDLLASATLVLLQAFQNPLAHTDPRLPSLLAQAWKAMIQPEGIVEAP